MRFASPIYTLLLQRGQSGGPCKGQIERDTGARVSVMTDAFPMIRYCSWLASTQKTASMGWVGQYLGSLGCTDVGCGNNNGREGVACAEMNSR